MIGELRESSSYISCLWFIHVLRRHVLFPRNRQTPALEIHTTCKKYINTCQMCQFQITHCSRHYCELYRLADACRLKQVGKIDICIRSQHRWAMPVFSNVDNERITPVFEMMCQCCWVFVWIWVRVDRYRRRRPCAGFFNVHGMHVRNVTQCTAALGLCWRWRRDQFPTHVPAAAYYWDKQYTYSIRNRL